MTSEPTPGATTPATAPRPFAFVLMPFAKQFDDVFAFGIRGAAERAGAYAERTDKQLFEGSILERVFNQINKADIVVADLTGRNPNVFYEVGYAHALNKLVVLLTQNEDDVPFDLKGFRHVVYDGTASSLESPLEREIRWAIEETARRAAPAPRGEIRLDHEGTAIPETSQGGEGPTIVLKTDDMTKSVLRLAVRNVGAGATSEIAHVYAFVGGSSPVRLGRFVRSASNPAEDDVFPLRSIRSGEPWTALGLPVQAKLEVRIPPVPPGGAEILDVPLRFVSGLPIPPTPMALRLHDGLRWSDYRFSASVEFDRR